MATEPKASEAGVTAGAAAPLPVPLRLTVLVVGDALWVMVRLPLAAVAVVGRNCTFTVQLPPAATLPPAAQLPPLATTKAALLTAIVATDSTAVPLLRRVTVCAVLVLPTATVPKASVAGVTVATGPALTLGLPR